MEARPHIERRQRPEPAVIASPLGMLRVLVRRSPGMIGHARLRFSIEQASIGHDLPAGLDTGEGHRRGIYMNCQTCVFNRFRPCSGDL